jgi:RimJ/RimL family protein N-acetyltransferase
MLKTERLLLRKWKPTDLEEFARINADPKVCEFLPSVMRYGESNKLAYSIMSHFEKHAFGLWAVERVDIGRFIGFTGLSIPSFTAHFTPCVEIGWRLGSEHWGKGYATEAAKAALAHGFEQLKLPEIVSFTSLRNERSRAVMEKIGMKHNPDDDFFHPRLDHDHPLALHVLYRAKRGLVS